MRMRHKKHLDERLAACSGAFLARESEDFYATPVAQRHFVVDVARAFGNDNPVTLEIGCGKAGWVLQSARNNPARNYIAVEKLSNVIVVGAELAQQQGLSNVLFLNCSAENLMFFLPPKCVDEIVLNFSCPFPKKAYRNRRLTYPTFLEKYRLLLKDGGVVRQKTDDEEFFEFSLEQYAKCGFEVTALTRDLHASGWDNITTEYEQKFVSLGKKIFACVAVPPQSDE